MAKNVKRFGDARDNADFKGKRSTMPPRTREGKEFAGGRSLRRAKKNLSMAQKAYVPHAPNSRQHKRTLPGSMTL